MSGMMAGKKPLSLVQVLYNWEATPSSSPSAISISKDQMITVYQKFDNGWWVGTIEGLGATGIFPGSYVKEVQVYPQQPLPQQHLTVSTSAIVTNVTPTQPVLKRANSLITTEQAVDLRERCIAIKPYKGTSPQLSFEEGDELIVIEKWKTGWCRGICNGKTGLFHKDYVVAAAAYKKAPTSAPIALPSQQQTVSRPAGMAPQQSDHVISDVLFKARALYDFVGQDDTELTFKTGTIINVHKILEDNGWWLGELNGKAAHFPGNYVEKLADTTADNKMTTTTTSEPLGLARALFDYTAMTSGELTFTKGAIIRITNKHVAEGWWTGEYEGKIGHFPINYVEEFSNATLPTRSQTAPAPLIRSSSTPSFDSFPSTVSSYSSSSTSSIVFSTASASGQPVVKAEVLYDYEDRSISELVLKKGDIIRVLEMPSDSGWWMGELNSIRGHFPASFVRVIKEPSEAEKAEAERKERERLQLIEERLAAEAARREQERIEKETQLEQERLEHERLERERLEKERLEHERERLETERLEHERLENERLEKERLERERLEKLERERQEKEKLERDRLEKERLANERLERERIEKERKKEKDKQEKDRLERERRERERREKERLDIERVEREKIEKEKAEKERARLEADKLARTEKERLEKEQAIKEAAEEKRKKKKSVKMNLTKNKKKGEKNVHFVSQPQPIALQPQPPQQQVQPLAPQPTQQPPPIPILPQSKDLDKSSRALPRPPTGRVKEDGDKDKDKEGSGIIMDPPAAPRAPKTESPIPQFPQLKRPLAASAGGLPSVPLRPLPRAVALWAYQGKTATELSFEKDEIITIEAELPGEWWRGRIPPNRKGHFPKSYVQMLLDPAPYDDPSTSTTATTTNATTANMNLLVMVLQQQVAALSLRVEEEVVKRTEKLEKELTEMKEKYEAEAAEKAKIQSEFEELKKSVAGLATSGGGGGGGVAGEESRLDRMDKELIRLDDQIKAESRARLDLEAFHNRTEGEVEALNREVQKIKRTLDETTTKPTLAQSLKKTGRDLSV